MLQSMHHPNIIHIEDVYLSDTKICMVRFAKPAIYDNKSGQCEFACMTLTGKPFLFSLGDRIHGRWGAL